MRYLRYSPGPPLSQFVRLLWLYEGYSQPHALERVLPTGEMQLVINLQQDRSCIYDRDDPRRFETYSGSLISGAHSEYIVISTAMQAYVIGTCFRAGGAHPFLHVPAGELRDTTVSLDALWGADAVDLRSRLLEAPTHAARFHVLESALLARLRFRGEHHAAVDFALRHFLAEPQMTTIAGVTGQIGLTPKRFIQAFRDATGFTPKVFCRIQRFQRALNRMENGASMDWAGVALDSGYYDQAHFIHDFRAFSGINPTTYMAHRTPHRNHVPLAE